MSSTSSSRNLHGTRSSYVKHRCRCEACTNANAAYQRDWMRAQRRPDPTPSRTVGAADAHAVLAVLEAAGWRRRELATATKLSRSTLDAIAVQATATVRRTTMVALSSLIGTTPPRRVDARAARAALKALRTAGYSGSSISRAARLTDGRLRLRGRSVDVATHAALLELAETLGAEITTQGEIATPPLPAHLAASAVNWAPKRLCEALCILTETS